MQCVESQLQEARSISLNHEQKVTDDLLILLQYLLQQALKYGVPLPISTTTEEPIDPLQYLHVDDEKAIGEILTQTISACKHCLLVMARAVDPDSPFYDILESVIYLQEDSEDLIKKELLLFAFDVVNVRYLPPRISIPSTLSMVLLSGLLTPQDDVLSSMQCVIAIVAFVVVSPSRSPSALSGERSGNALFLFPIII